MSLTFLGWRVNNRKAAPVWPNLYLIEGKHYTQETLMAHLSAKARDDFRRGTPLSYRPKEHEGYLVRQALCAKKLVPAYSKGGRVYKSLDQLAKEA